MIFILHEQIKLGIGDWGLGIGDWAQSPIPNPQSPIPNPHMSENKKIIFYIYLKYIINIFYSVHISHYIINSSIKLISFNDNIKDSKANILFIFSFDIFIIGRLLDYYQYYYHLKHSFLNQLNFHFQIYAHF